MALRQLARDASMPAILAGIIVPNGINFTFLENILHIDPGYATLIGGIGLIITAIQNPEGLAGAPRIIRKRRIDAAVRKSARQEVE